MPTHNTDDTVVPVTPRIAWASYTGHRNARELDATDIGDTLTFRREPAQLARD